MNFSWQNQISLHPDFDVSLYSKCPKSERSDFGHSERCSIPKQFGAVWNPNKIVRFVKHKTSSKPVWNWFCFDLFTLVPNVWNRKFDNRTKICSVCQTECSVFGRSLYLLCLSKLEGLKRLLVELQILIHLVLELSQLHQAQLGQVNLHLAGPSSFRRHLEFSREKYLFC